MTPNTNPLDEAPATLSPARLGEALAHLTFFACDGEDAVLAQLGYDPSAFRAATALVKSRLTAAVDLDRPDVLTAYTSAYEVTLRVLRARRPRLAHVRCDPNLEPTLSRRALSPKAEMTPLPVRARAPETEIAVPTFLRPPDPPTMKPLVLADPDAREETVVVDGRTVFGGSDLPFQKASDAPVSPRAARPPEPRNEDE